MFVSWPSIAPIAPRRKDRVVEHGGSTPCNGSGYAAVAGVRCVRVGLASSACPVVPFADQERPAQESAGHIVLMVVCHRPCTSAPRSSSSAHDPASSTVTTKARLRTAPDKSRPSHALDDAHARLILIYACNIRRDRAPPRRASVRIFHNALPISVDRTAPSHVPATSCPRRSPQVLQLVDVYWPSRVEVRREIAQLERRLVRR